MLQRGGVRLCRPGARLLRPCAQRAGGRGNPDQAAVGADVLLPQGQGAFSRCARRYAQGGAGGCGKRRVQEEQIRSWSDELQRGTVPEALRAILPQLLYRPDRNRIETKALELAGEASGLSAARLFERAGACLLYTSDAAD